MLIFEGKEISTDSEGYLKETTQWSEALAVAIAANEGIEPLRNTGKSCASCANFTEFNTSPAIECW